MPATRNLAIIGFLCVLGLVLFALTGEPEYTGPEELPPSIARLTEIDTGAITEVVLEGNGKSVTLAREGEAWVVPSAYGYPGDTKRVESLLEQLGAIAAPQERGTSAASHATFEVGAEKGLRIRLQGTGDGLPASFTLGKVESYDRVYIRVEDDDAVYSITPNLRFAAGLAGELSSDNWIDLQLATIPEELDIEAFRWETPDGAIELRRVLEETTVPDTDEPATTPVWKVIEPETFVADDATVRSLRSSVRVIRAASAADPAAAEAQGLAPPQRTMTISIADEDPVVLEFGASGPIGDRGTGVHARRRGDDRTFVVQEFTVTNLFKSLDRLKPAEEEPTGPESGPAPAPPPPPPPPTTDGG